MRAAYLAALVFLTGCASTSAPPPPAPSVTLNWSAVTKLSDGSALTDLSGYEISYGPQGGGRVEKSVSATTCTLPVTAGRPWVFEVAAMSVAHGMGIPATVSYTVP